jgi:hypothetical protein
MRLVGIPRTELGGSLLFPTHSAVELRNGWGTPLLRKRGIGWRA